MSVKKVNIEVDNVVLQTFNKGFCLAFSGRTRHNTVYNIRLYCGRWYAGYIIRFLRKVLVNEVREVQTLLKGCVITEDSVNSEARS